MGHNTPSVLVVKNKVSAGRLVQKTSLRAPRFTQLRVPPKNTGSGGSSDGEPLAGSLEGIRNCSYLLLAGKGDPATTVVPQGQAAHTCSVAQEKQTRSAQILTALPTLHICMQAMFGEGEEKENLLELDVTTCTWAVMFWHL